jgi:biopolymer transport protein ExbB
MNLFFSLTAQATKNIDKNLFDYWMESNGSGGWVINSILIIMLGYTIFVFVERYLALRRASTEETGLLKNVKTSLQSGNLEAAKQLCNSSDSPIAKMLLKGISRIGTAKNDSIASTIENTGKFEILRLEQRLSFLATASGAAPMLGFLGTVMGMVGVFIALSGTQSLELSVIAPGMMTAMITTVEGLIVGILAFMGYNYLVGQIGKVVYQMENAAIEFMDVLNESGK